MWKKITFSVLGIGSAIATRFGINGLVKKEKTMEEKKLNYLDN